MNKKEFLLLLLVLILGAADRSFGFSPQRTFDVAAPGYRFEFPRDHGAHPSFRTEWWYFTGNVQSRDKKEYGFELTFFRQGMENPKVLENPSRWAVRDLYLAHFAVTDIGRKSFFYQDQISREALGKAGAREDRLEVWIDRWRAEQKGEDIHLSAEENPPLGEDRTGWKIDLVLSPAKPPTVHGMEGVSKKGEEPGQASHYYSFTRLDTRGTLSVNGREEQVTGWSWMDHEFGSALLNRHQVGWDWFSLQMEDGTDYMFFQIRRENGGRDPVSSGTVIAPDGTTRHLTADEFILKPVTSWKSPASAATYPIGWQIEIPSEKLSLRSETAVPNQELITSQSTRITYWEGASRFRGTKEGRPAAGKGYIEMTGYAAPFGK